MAEKKEKAKQPTAADIWREIQDLKEMISIAHPVTGTQNGVKSLASSVQNLNDRLKKVEEQLSEKKQETEKEKESRNTGTVDEGEPEF